MTITLMAKSEHIKIMMSPSEKNSFLRKVDEHLGDFSKVTRAIIALWMSKEFQERAEMLRDGYKLSIASQERRESELREPTRFKKP